MLLLAVFLRRKDLICTFPWVSWGIRASSSSCDRPMKGSELRRTSMPACAATDKAKTKRETRRRRRRRRKIRVYRRRGTKRRRMVPGFMAGANSLQWKSALILISVNKRYQQINTCKQKHKGNYLYKRSLEILAWAVCLTNTLAHLRRIETQLYAMATLNCHCMHACMQYSTVWTRRYESENELNRSRDRKVGLVPRHVFTT